VRPIPSAKINVPRDYASPVFKLLTRTKGVEGCILTIGIAIALSGSLARSAVTYESAHQMMTNGEWSHAETALAELHREAPQSALITGDYAKVLLRVNKRRLAIQLFRKLADLQSIQSAGDLFLQESSKQLYQEGLLALLKNQLGLATEKLELALEQDDGHRAILFRLAQIEGLKGNWAKAEELLQNLEALYSPVGSKGLTAIEKIWLGRAHTFGEKPIRCKPLLLEGGQELKDLEDAALWLKDCLIKLNLMADARYHLIESVRANPVWVEGKLAYLELDPTFKEKASWLSQIARSLELKPSAQVKSDASIEAIGRHVRLLDHKALEGSLKKLNATMEGSL